MWVSGIQDIQSKAIFCSFAYRIKTSLQQYFKMNHNKQIYLFRKWIEDRKSSQSPSHFTQSRFHSFTHSFIRTECKVFCSMNTFASSVFIGTSISELSEYLSSKRTNQSSTTLWMYEFLPILIDFKSFLSFFDMSLLCKFTNMCVYVCVRACM